ncbi:MAG: WD40 repeat domain-containing protein [Synechococcales cyanobacterium RM1_1_8]|nr:WD40 repeat domain-containing protein [Synechococcales cyanobacterium RM1_1_8]
MASRAQTSAQPSTQKSTSTLALWNLDRGTRLITLLKPGSASAQAIAFSPDSKRIAAILANGQVQVWDTTTGNSLRTWKAHSDSPRALAISPNGKWLVTGSGDRTVKLWDLNSGKLLKTLSLGAGETQASAVQGLLISPASTRLAIATDRSIQLWDLPNGRLLKVALARSPLVADTLGTNLSQAMAFSPNGKSLATLDLDNSIKLWNTGGGARMITLRQHQRPIEAIAFSPDGQTLLSRDASQSVLFWNLQTYENRLTISVDSGNRPNPQVDPRDSRATQQPIIPSPDGKTFAVPITAVPLPGTTVPGSGFALDLRDAMTGIHLVSLDDVQQANFSPDNRFLVTQGQELRVWQP